MKRIFPILFLTFFITSAKTHFHFIRCPFHEFFSITHDIFKKYHIFIFRWLFLILNGIRLFFNFIWFWYTLRLESKILHCKQYNLMKKKQKKVFIQNDYEWNRKLEERKKLIFPSFSKFFMLNAKALSVNKP